MIFLKNKTNILQKLLEFINQDDDITINKITNYLTDMDDFLKYLCIFKIYYGVPFDTATLQIDITALIKSRHVQVDLVQEYNDYLQELKTTYDAAIAENRGAHKRGLYGITCVIHKKGLYS